MKERILNVLNIKRSESDYVFDLLTVQFFMGVANAFINIIVFTYFIFNYTITGLPYAYLCMSVALLLLTVVYEKLEHRFSPLQLLRIILIASAAILFLFWGGIAFTSSYTVVFLLLVWSMLFYMLTGYAFWGLVALLFNIRESKRIFSIVGGGDIPAKLIGYATAPLLISVIGINNLLLISLFAVLTGLYFLNRLRRNENCSAVLGKMHALPHQHQHKKKGESGIKFFFRNGLIFTISVLSIISYIFFTLTDFTFIAQIKIKSFSLVDLSTFIAVFFAFGRFVAMVLKLTFTSRVIERLGIFSCLFITPLTLLVFCIIIILVDQGSHSTLYIFGAMALLAEVLRSTLQEPVFFILFQPLTQNLRLKGHVIAKGYMLTPALFLVGSVLILLPAIGVSISILLIAKMLLVTLVLWVITLLSIKKEYIKLLRSSIAKGIFSSESLHIYDKKTIDILLEKIVNGKAPEIIYALKLLEQAQYPEIDDVLNNLLFHSHPDVKKYVLSVLDHTQNLNKERLKDLLNTEEDTEVREQLISTLCNSDRAFLDDMANQIDSLDNNVKKIVIIQLLNQKEFSYMHRASSHINQLLISTDHADKVLALDIISKVKTIQFTHAILALLQDEEPTVRRNAIITACKLNIAPAIPYMMESLNNSNEKYIVLKGLLQYGDALFEDLKQLPVHSVESHMVHLIKAAGKIKGPHSSHFLLARLTDQSLNEKIVHALWSKDCQDDIETASAQLENLLNFYLKSGIQKIKDYNAVPHFADHELIKSCLKSEIKNDLETSLKICALLYKRKEINRVLELIMYNENQKIFNAMEVLEIILNKKVSAQINVLFDKVMDPGYVRRTETLYDVKTLFKKIIITNEKMFNIWTKAVCIYCSLKNDQLDLVEKINIAESEVISETKNYVLNFR